jgi:hypothetical protein
LPETADELHISLLAFPRIIKKTRLQSKMKKNNAIDYVFMIQPHFPPQLVMVLIMCCNPQGSRGHARPLQRGVA